MRCFSWVPCLVWPFWQLARRMRRHGMNNKKTKTKTETETKTKIVWLSDTVGNSWKIEKLFSWHWGLGTVREWPDSIRNSCDVFVRTHPHQSNTVCEQILSNLIFLLYVCPHPGTGTIPLKVETNIFLFLYHLFSWFYSWRFFLCRVTVFRRWAIPITVMWS